MFVKDKAINIVKLSVQIMGKISAKEQFFQAWDNWHFQWSEHLKTGSLDKKIAPWEIPMDRKGKPQMGNQVKPIFNYFPEPYLHRGDKSKIKFLFLNINPGGGGQIQDFDERQTSQLYLEYFERNGRYTLTMDKFLSMEKIGSETNKTAEWYSKRENWTKSIFGDKNVPKGSVLCADLIPWHSKKESDVIEYICNNQKTIFKYVIEPLISMANEINADNPHVIVRGVAFFNLINAWLQNTISRLKVICSERESAKWEKSLIDLEKNIENEKKAIRQFVVMDVENKFFSKFNSYLAEYVLEFNGKKVTFLIFSGGANMDLPNSEYMVLPILKEESKGKPVSLKQFICKFQ